MSQAGHDFTTPTAARLRARLDVAVEKLIEALDTLHGRLGKCDADPIGRTPDNPARIGPICPL